MRYYYVYAYLDPRKPGSYTYEDYHFDYEPFYIGKGKRYRINAHIRQARSTNKNSFKLNKIRKILNEGLEPILTKVKVKLSNDESLLIEESLIALIGRICENEGPLTNIEKAHPCKGERHQITKDKMSKSRKGKKHSEETKAKMKASHTGSKKSKDIRDKISNSMKGRKLSQETRDKISNSMKKK